MTTTQIRCFLEAANASSFTEAAEKVYMTQPTFGRQISALEKELGFSLFLRGGKSNHLTAAGREMYEGLSVLSAQLESLVSRARDISGGGRGRLRIGLLEGQLLDWRLKRWLADFRGRFPGIQVTLDRYSFHSMLSAIRAGELDIGVTLELDVERRPEFDYRRIYTLKNKLVVPRSHPLARREGLTLADFAGDTFIEVELAESDVISALMQRSCQDAGFTPRFMRTADLRTQILAAESGFGICAFNEYHQACNHPELISVEVPELPEVAFCAAWSRTGGNPAVEFFVELLTEEAEPEEESTHAL